MFWLAFKLSNLCFHFILFQIYYLKDRYAIFIIYIFGFKMVPYFYSKIQYFESSEDEEQLDNEQLEDESFPITDFATCFVGF